LVVIGALAVAVSVVGAGPAFAAKGGNSNNAHTCQQGGHENLFDTETGKPFKNAGACVSHGAHAGATSSLQVVADTYKCAAIPTLTCWGTVSGSGLEGPPLGRVTVNVFPSLRTITVDTAGDGSVNAKLELACGVASQDANAVANSTTASGATIGSTITARAC
jgi:hypothetical protein